MDIRPVHTEADYKATLKEMDNFDEQAMHMHYHAGHSPV